MPMASHEAGTEAVVNSFWKLLGPCGAEFLTTLSGRDPSDIRRQRRRLLASIWDERLGRVPVTVLSNQSKTHVRDGVKTRLADSTSDAALVIATPPQAPFALTSGVFGDQSYVPTAGFEKVWAAAAGDVAACWFLDAGAAAWLVTLTGLRIDGLLPSDPAFMQLDDVERAWTTDGSDGRTACDLLDMTLTAAPLAHPALALYRAPLALWCDRDPRRAIRWLDHAVSRMTDQQLDVCRPTIQLTYAFAHALCGHITDAAIAVSVDREHEEHTGAPSDPGVVREVTYHRARYLWSDGNAEEAMTCLRPVLMEDPAYLLRLVTDPIWRVAAMHTLDALDGMLHDIATEARTALAAPGVAPQTIPSDVETTRAGEQTQLARRANVPDEPYVILTTAAQQIIHTQRSLTVQQNGHTMGHSAPSVSLQEAYARMSAFASALPSTFPLRLGDEFGPQFRGHGESDMAVLDALMADHAWDEAAQFVGILESAVPHAVQHAALNCLTRLTQAIVTRGDLLTTPVQAGHPHPSDGDLEGQQRQAAAYAAQCVALSDSILQLPDDVSSLLAFVLTAIWERIASIQHDWTVDAFAGRDHYDLEVSPTLVSLGRTDPTVLVVTVRDEYGHPVVGCPIVWRVVSGPATPADRTRCVMDEWAMTGADGVTTLRLVSATLETGASRTTGRDVGVIELQCCDHPRVRAWPQPPVKRVAYRVVDYAA